MINDCMFIFQNMLDTISYQSFDVKNSIRFIDGECDTHHQRKYNFSTFSIYYNLYSSVFYHDFLLFVKTTK